MLCGAVRALFPIEEELAVAVRETSGWVDVEFGQSLVYPGCGTFEFGVVADGSLVDDEMSCGLRVGAGSVGPLGAVLLVDEGGSVAKLLEDLGESLAFRDGGLGLDADLVASGVDRVLLVRLAFMGDGAERAVLADAEDLPKGAEVAVRCVVEGVVLEGAGSVEVKAELGETGLEIVDVGYGDLEFDLGTLHGVSIRLDACSAAIG
jgi:hypothetical protein